MPVMHDIPAPEPTHDVDLDITTSGLNYVPPNGRWNKLSNDREHRFENATLHDQRHMTVVDYR